MESETLSTATIADRATDTSIPIAMNLLPSQIAHLEMISHLSSYSDLMIIVAGPSGAGKTFMATAIELAQGSTNQVLRIDAYRLKGFPRLTQKIADHWGLGRMPESGEQQRQLLINAAKYHDGQGHGLLIIIDNAEQLDKDTLNEIAVMAKLVSCGLSVVMLGETGFDKALRGSASQAELHRIELLPVTTAERQQLVQYYQRTRSIEFINEVAVAAALKSNQLYPADVLKQLDAINQTSSGSSMLAVGVLDNRVSTSKLLFASVVVFILVGLLALSGSLSERQFLTTEPASPEQVNLTSESSNARPELDDSIMTESVLARFEPDAVNQDSFEKDSTQQDIPQPVLEVVQEAEISVQQQDGANLTSDVAKPVAAIQIVENQPQTPSDSVMVRAPSMPVMVVEPNLDQVSAPVAVATISSAPSELDTSSDIQPTVEESKSPAVVLSRQLSALKALSDGHMIQLMGLSQEADARKFVSTWQPEVAQNLYQYQTQYQQKNWYVVIAGPFPNAELVKKAIEQLPDRLKAAKPWVRSIADIQKALQ